MEATSTPRAAERDNLLGVCHAIGVTFGFDPLWLRLAMVFAVLADFELALLAYLTAAVAVTASRLLAGEPRAVTSLQST
jgi:phage shock protein PspC (stress-responsive transcriptional regulator)